MKKKGKFTQFPNVEFLLNSFYFSNSSYAGIIQITKESLSNSILKRFIITIINDYAAIRKQNTGFKGDKHSSCVVDFFKCKPYGA